jgi:hypothetical protein
MYWPNFITLTPNTSTVLERRLLVFCAENCCRDPRYLAIFDNLSVFFAIFASIFVRFLHFFRDFCNFFDPNLLRLGKN